MFTTEISLTEGKASNSGTLLSVKDKLLPIKCFEDGEIECLWESGIAEKV